MISYPVRNDLKGILRLFQACIMDMNQQGIDQWDDQYPNFEVIEADFANQSLFVARKDDEIVGVISVDDQQPEEYGNITWQDQTNALVIHRLAVRPDVQNRGIAKALMSHAEAVGKQAAYQSIRLDTYSGNERAVNFYKKLGYATRGEAWFPRRTKSFYCMEKSLKIDKE